MPRHTTVLPGGASLARPQIASKPGDLDKVSQERWRLRGKRQVRDYALEQFYFRWGEGCLGGACGAHRLIIVSQNMRQLRMQNTEILRVDHRELQRRVPIEEKESYRWLENMRQSTALLGDPVRCIHVGDQESDIYELFCRAYDLSTCFLVRTCVDRLVGDGQHTIADEMEQVKIKGLHRVEIRDAKGHPMTVTLELRYQRMTSCNVGICVSGANPFQNSVARTRRPRCPSCG